MIFRQIIAQICIILIQNFLFCFFADAAPAVLSTSAANVPNLFGNASTSPPLASGTTWSSYFDEDLAAAVPSFSYPTATGIASKLIDAKEANKQLDGESRLINKWLADANVGRPRRNHSERVDVKLGFSLFSMSNVDEDAEEAVLHGLKLLVVFQYSWMLMTWKDEHLSWNASEYGGVEILSVSDEMVWKPDITMYNAASHDNTVKIFGATNVNIFPEGVVLWGPPTTLHVPLQRTESDEGRRAWPRDRYKLSARLGSWSHDSTLVNILPSTDALKGGTADLSDYVESNRWKLLNFTSHAQDEAFGCCPDIKFTMMLFEVEVERKPNFLLHLVDWPVKIALVSTCLLFAIPVSAVGLRLLASAVYVNVYAVMLLILEEMLPHGAIYAARMPLPIVTIVCALLLLLFNMVWIALIGAFARVPHQKRFPRLLLPALHGIGHFLLLNPGTSDDEQKIALFERNQVEDGGEPASNASNSAFATTNEAAPVSSNSWLFAASVFNRAVFLGNVICIVGVFIMTF